MRKSVLAGIGLSASLLFGAAACTTNSDVASDNISKDADQFKILRRVVFVNGITDKYILSVEGYCSITDEGNQLEVICKVGTGYKKHFLGLSDNISYFAEQLEAASVSTSHYKVVFKPEVIIPNVVRP